MEDEKLAAIERSIASMEKARSKRLKELADPNRSRIRTLWDELNVKIDELNKMGENLTDMNGDTLHIEGTRFSRSGSGEIIEK